MRNLYQATSRAVRLNSSKGFTLIELLVVIAIIAILASLAIPQYLKYQKKARVSSYAEPIARGCIMDYAAWCMENPGQQVNATALANCATTNVTTAGGPVSLNASLQKCNEDGSPNDNTVVTARLSGINDFIAECVTKDSSIRCTIKSQ